MSHGTSRSRTDGTSETHGTSFTETEGTTYGTSYSETDGTTRGTSKSRSAGSNETIQKRALVTPDEIGQLFARIDDRAHHAYPGLALVVISGARPVALRRTNYYEDYQFFGLFDPHPDHPFTPWRELCVEGRQLGFSLAEVGLRIGGWSIKQRQLVRAGDEAATVLRDGSITPAARIRVPRIGLIATVQGGGEGGDLPPGALFSLRHYEDGAALIDPFSEIRALRVSSAKPKEVVAPRKRRLPVAVVAGFVGILILVAIVTTAVIKDQAGRGPAATGTQGGSSPVPANTATPPPSVGRAEPASPAPGNPAVSAPTIDPNYDPIGAGGNIQSPQRTETNVTVCVPANLVRNESWDSPSAGSKMEAFKNAATNAILADAGIFDISNPNTQFRVLDVFDNFDPSSTNPDHLVAAVTADTKACPSDSYAYTLPVKQ